MSSSRRAAVWVMVGVLGSVGGLWRVAHAAGGGRIAVPALPDVKEGEDSGVKDGLEQGVTLAVRQGESVDVRPMRLVALRVPAGEAPTAMLKPGAFTATFTGNLNQRLRSSVTFVVESAGKFELKVGGNVVLAGGGDEPGTSATATPVKLNKGKNPIELSYASPAKGDAVIRLMWSSNDFPVEPVQPGVLTRDAKAEALRAANRLREGRELLANLKCGACHALPAEAKGATGRMPELSAEGPDLSDAGARLKAGWMAAWIANPRALRADAEMPRVFHGAKGDAEAADVAAYLATLGKPAAGPMAPADDEAMVVGGQLFAGLGCIGCHTKPDAEAAQGGARVPLNLVNAKYQPGALRAWLLDPQRHDRWTRMPNFHLTEFEADRLVAYLTKKAAGKVADAPVGDAAKGKALFASAGCANCHAIAGVTSTLAGAKPLAELLTSSDWAHGCVAAKAEGKAPDFGLREDRRGALVAYAAAGAPGLGADVAAEFAQRAVRRLNCAACHARDEVDDRWTALADEVSDLAPPEGNIENDQTEEAGGKGRRPFYPANLGKLLGGDRVSVGGDQQRPSLTWAGERLRPEWAEAFIAGKVAYKPRYWLRSRMPAFPAHAAGLARGMALEHGFPVTSPTLREPKAELAQIGQHLSGRDAGFACITCHSIGDTRAVSPFEAPAPNFAHVTDRLTEDFYLRWMRKPLRYQPGTKMPQFSEGGKTDRRDVLDGDADKQFGALWEFMLGGEKIQAPE